MFTIRREIPTQLQRDGIFAALYAFSMGEKRKIILIKDTKNYVFPH